MGAEAAKAEEAGGEKGAAPATARGICSTCNLAPTCALLLRNPDQVVWECEEFDNYEAPRVQQIVAKHRGQRGALMSILEEIQSRYGFLPKSALRAVAENTGTSLVDLYAVATFYRAFSLKPRGKHLASVCLGTACHVRGGRAVADEFQRALGIAVGETTADRSFTLETVNCLGACALGPVVVIDGHYFPHAAPGKVAEILAQARAGLDVAARPDDQRVFPVEVNCPRCNHSLMDYDYLIDGRPSVRVTVSFGDTHSWLRLSSLYGSYNIAAEHDVPHEAVVNFFCPHCHAELRGATACPECGAPMVPMLVRGGVVVQICSRRGCKGHILDLAGTYW